MLAWFEIEACYQSKSHDRGVCRHALGDPGMSRGLAGVQPEYPRANCKLSHVLGRYLATVLGAF